MNLSDCNGCTFGVLAMVQNILRVYKLVFLWMTIQDKKLESHQQYFCGFCKDCRAYFMIYFIRNFRLFIKFWRSSTIYLPCELND